MPGRDEKHIIRFSHIDEYAAAAAKIITDMLENDGFAFFDRYSSLEECSLGLNEPIDAISHPLFNRFPSRAYYGVTAASITDPDRVPNLIRKYIEFIRSSGVVDQLMYDVGKDKAGVDAITERLETVARLGLASA